MTSYTVTRELSAPGQGLLRDREPFANPAAQGPLVQHN